jgi:hypothetical protein
MHASAESEANLGYVIPECSTIKFASHSDTDNPLLSGPGSLLPVITPAEFRDVLVSEIPGGLPPE